MRWMPMLGIAVMLLGMSACAGAGECCGASQDCCAEITVIGTAAAAPKLIGRADVQVAGNCIGSVRTLQGEGEGSTSVTAVLNTRGDMVGFVTADGSAYRGRAAGPRIGQGKDLRELAGLILGVEAGQRVTLSGVHGKLIPGFPGHL